LSFDYSSAWRVWRRRGHDGVISFGNFDTYWHGLSNNPKSLHPDISAANGRVK
jgi:hypothetical protein